MTKSTLIKFSLFIQLLWLLPNNLFAQAPNGIKQIGGDEQINYAAPVEYTIADIDVKGLKTLDKSVIKLMSGLYQGQKIKIPGDASADAIKKLWKAGFFDDVKLFQEKIVGKDVWLSFEVIEKPHLWRYNIKGAKKSEVDDLREKLRLAGGKILTDYLVKNSITQIKEFYIDKGYYNVAVDTTCKVDPKSKNKDLEVVFWVKKGKKNTHSRC
jgi:outer membrane protein insertion porin family